LLSPLRATLKIGCFQKSKTHLPIDFWRWVGKLFEADYYLEGQPPRARRHTHTAHTTDAELRVLLEEMQHRKSLHDVRRFGNRTRLE
jgi:hypothetical protein